MSINNEQTSPINIPVDEMPPAYFPSSARIEISSEPDNTVPEYTVIDITIVILSNEDTNQIHIISTLDPYNIIMTSPHYCDNNNDDCTSKEGVYTPTSHNVHDSDEKEGACTPTSYPDNDSNNEEGMSTTKSRDLNDSITKEVVPDPTSRCINQDSHTIRSLYKFMSDEDSSNQADFVNYEEGDDNEI